MSKYCSILRQSVTGENLRPKFAGILTMKKTVLEFKNFLVVRLLSLSSLLPILSLSVFAQNPRLATTPPPPEDNTMYYIILVVFFAALGGAVFYWWRSKQSPTTPIDEKPAINTARVSSNGLSKKNGNKSSDSPVDREKRENREVEAWIREQALLAKEGAMGKNKKKKKVKPKPEPEIERLDGSDENKEVKRNYAVPKSPQVPFVSLPILKIRQLIQVKDATPLPFSFEPEVDEAIEQIRQEDNDEEFREIAVRILAAFRAQNAIDALAQVAHYDLSQRLRVAAVVALGELDHQAVFEPILLACADMSREVKAAAARTLIKLNIDRADCFSQILQSEDEERIRMAALSCQESGLAERAFDRLLSEDFRQAYEAFVILTLLVCAKHPELIFQTIESNRNPKISLAAIHVLSCLENFDYEPELERLVALDYLPSEVRTMLTQLLERFSVSV